MQTAQPDAGGGSPQQTGQAPASLPARGGFRIHAPELLAGHVQRTGGFLFRGEEVQLRFGLAGLTTRNRRIHVTARLRLTDARGRTIHSVPPLAVRQAIPKGRATDVVLLALRFRVPPLAPPGPGKLRLSVRDGFGGREVAAEIPVRVHGPQAPEGGGLRVLSWQLPAPEDVRGGLPWVADLDVAGLRPRVLPKKAAGPAPRSAPAARYAVRLVGASVLRDARGRPLARHDATLLDATVPFPVGQAHLRWRIPLPPSLPPGEYRLHLTLTEPHSARQVTATHRVRLAPAALGIYAVRLRAGGVPRRTVGRGESLTLEFAVAGWTRDARLALGLGLVGPDHGVYFVRKRAHVLTVSAADRSPRRLRIPLQIPEFVPTGRWTLQLRAADPRGGELATRSVRFTVAGAPLPPQSRLTVQRLALYHPGDPLPVPGVFVRAGSALRLRFVVGGMRLAREGGYYHRVRLRCAVRLRDRTGRLVADDARACSVDRRFSFQPRRLRLQASFQLPPTALGLHHLEVEVLDLASDRVGLLVRKLFLVADRRPRSRASRARDKGPTKPL